jgi:predicted RNA polymerase sigma factor
MPDEPEVHGLLALLELTAARFPARTGLDGEPVLLEQQDRVVILYEALSLLAPSPVVDLNRAVAVAMAQGPTAALPIVDQLLAAGAMPESHLLPSVRGELLIRLGRYDQARVELEHALALCGNERERTVLRRKITYIANHG